MTFKRNLLLLVLAFLVNANLVLALIKPRIVTSPIVIDDIVAVGGGAGVVCGWGTYSYLASSSTTQKGVFVPITSSSKKERYKITVKNSVSESTEAFRIGIINSPLIGIDPLKNTVTYTNGDAIITSSLKSAIAFVLRVHPVENGVEITDETRKYSFTIDALSSAYDCRVDISWNPRLRAFPNPTSGLAKLSFFVPIAAGVNIMLYDQSNNLIYQNKNYNAVDGYNEVDVDLTVQRIGVFTGIIEIKESSGKVILRRTCLLQKI